LAYSPAKYLKPPVQAADNEQNPGNFMKHLYK
jgi:hypothetical protein